MNKPASHGQSAGRGPSTHSRPIPPLSLEGPAPAVRDSQTSPNSSSDLGRDGARPSKKWPELRVAKDRPVPRKLAAIPKLSLLVAVLIAPALAFGRSEYLAPAPPDIQWTQNIGARLPLDAPLRDAEDRPVVLGDYFGEGPVVLMLGYNRCPMLCDQQIQGLLQAFNSASLDGLENFSVLFLSVDPDEPTTLTREAQRNARKALARAGVEAEWTFLRGDEAVLREIAKAAGFAYKEDDKTGQIAHPAGFLVARSDGTISRYLFGVRFDARDLRLALIDAGRGSLGKIADQLLLLCFHYDPLTGKYGLAIARLIKIASLATLLLLGGWIGWHLRNERRARMT